MVGWFVVPGVLGGVLGGLLSAAWQYYSSKELRALESRLRKQEEGFRLAHSPRIAAAIDLWAAFCRYEDAVERAMYPSTFDTYEAPTLDEMDSRMRDDAHVKLRREQLRAAWAQLQPALAKAEILLDRGTYAACHVYFNACDSIYGDKTLADEFSGGISQHRLIQGHQEMKQSRENALSALKTMIGEVTRTKDG